MGEYNSHKSLELSRPVCSNITRAEGRHYVYIMCFLSVLIISNALLSSKQLEAQCVTV